jgi:acetoin utilization protein AcuB
MVLQEEIHTTLRHISFRLSDIVSEGFKEVREQHMIVQECMQTALVTVEPDDTVSHAVRLLRKHHFHHLPVVESIYPPHAQSKWYDVQESIHVFKGLLTSHDIDTAVLLAERGAKDHPGTPPWQEQRVVDIMQPASIYVTPKTSLAAAAQLLVERGLNCLPVIEPRREGSETQDILVGLITRSDILLAFAQVLGASKPGMEIILHLPQGHMAPLAKALITADILHIPVCSIVLSPSDQQTDYYASLRLRTINPAPFLFRLRTEGITYDDANLLLKGETHV